MQNIFIYKGEKVKTFQKMMVGLLMVLGLSSLANAEVRNYFINGVGNTRDEARSSRDKIQELADVGKIQVLYNTTEGAPIDFIEAGKMMINLDKFYTENGINHAYHLKDIVKDYIETNSIFQRTYPVVNRISIKYSSFKSEDEKKEYLDDIVDLIEDNGVWSEITFAYKYDITFDEALEYHKLIEVDGYKRILFAFGEYRLNNEIKLLPNSLDNIDLNAMYFELNISKDVKYNFIAHSQGNLFANRLLTLMVANGVPKENIRLLSVGTPDTFVFNNGKYINLREDLVATFSFLGLKRNKTNYEQYIWNIIEPDNSLTGPEKFGDILAKRIVTSTFNKKVFGDYSGHGFVKSYLKNNSYSKEFILYHFNKNYEELKALDDPKLEEDLWLERITLINGSEVKQGESIKFSGRLHYKSNEDPEGKKTKVCYAVSRKPMWDRNEFVSRVGDVDIALNKKISSKTTGTRALNINLDVPVGNYFLMMKADCDESMEETSETNFQVRYREIKVLSQEKEDVYSTNPRLYQKGPAKLMIKNEMVYKGSTPDIGYVYNMYFLSNQDRFSTAQYIHGMRARMGYEVDRRRTVQRTFNFKLPPGDYYMWIITKTPDMIHDDNHDNNYFKVHFSLKKKE